MKFLIKILASLLLLTMVGEINAQEVEWGPQLKQKRREVINRIVAEDEKGIYVLRFDNRRITYSLPVIEHFDKNLTFKYSRPLNAIHNRNTFFNECWEYNDKLFLFFSEYDNRNNVQTLFYQEINKQNGKLKSTPNSLVSVPAQSRNLLGNLRLSASLDSSKALIFYTPLMQRGLLSPNYKQTFTLKVIDQNLGEVWKKDVTVPYDEELIDIEKTGVDKDGNAYLLAKIYKDKRKDKRRGEVNFEYKLLAYTDNGSKYKEYSLQLQDKFISDITFKINAKGDITCAGFYSNRNTFSIKGAFFFTIDKSTSKIATNGLKEFDTSFVAKLTNRRKAEKGKELYRYYLDEIILRSDGGAVLTGEQFYVVSHTYYTGSGINRSPQTTYTYYYEDIIVININPDASIDWAVNIPKSQVSGTRDYSSYAVAIANGKLNFIYNERIGKRAPVMIASVSTKGEVGIKQLFSNKEIGSITRPALCEQTSRNEMVIFAERGRKYKFGKIIF